MPHKDPEKHRAWRAEYRARERELAKQRYAADPTRRLATNAKFRAANREKDRAWAAAWKQANPGHRCALNAKRRAAKLQRTPVWSETKQIKALYDCAARLTKCLQTEMHVDHWFPLQGAEVSGLHVLNNLRVITAAENLRKNNKWISEHALDTAPSHP